ncbi:DNA polymerase epsilon subunit B protein [Besnoitia besnoiti]|uniref:DNA polymerase epsilon subunit B protein n=1 Tax=Besnoitia besnoiti TaxID=94643 RepID=A0A2A9MKF1_BESBE|nr:DNA polymerase epsilon subunit B protein [Besnoitia besnoiti]PFH38465.1 DNA polymerase epsilon subunit B protein [Besnoitia besnoiti]
MPSSASLEKMEPSVGAPVPLLSRLEGDSSLTAEELAQLRQGVRHFRSGDRAGSAAAEGDSEPRKRERQGQGADADADVEGADADGHGDSAKKPLRAMRGGFLRATADYEDLGASRFVIRPRKYQQQYSAVYFSRLSALSGVLFRQAERLWPGVCIHACIRDVQTWQECVIVGTLFKDMALKQSVLRDYMDAVPTQTKPNSLLADTDSLFLEDQTARVRLLVDASSRWAASGGEPASDAEEEDSENRRVFRVNGVVTGLLVAVRGMPTDNGRFEVLEVCLGGAPAIPPLLPPSRALASDESLGGLSHPAFRDINLDSKFVAFVSDLRVGDAATDPSRLQLLRDFLLGAFGGPFERRLASRIARLVVAGNVLTAVQAYGSAASQAKTSASSNASLKAVLQEADLFLSQLASSLPVDLMPGDRDPTTFSLPQQPLHGALFPTSRAYSSIHGVSNPHAFSIDKVRFIGSSGQPVANICAFSDLSPLEALRLCAEGRCLAPTAPDTLSLYPFVKDDPFCIAEDADYQHAYFSANHEELSFARLRRTGTGAGEMESYANADGEGPLLLCVPSFAKSSTLVLVDIQSLAVYPLHLVFATEES